VQTIAAVPSTPPPAVESQPPPPDSESQEDEQTGTPQVVPPPEADDEQPIPLNPLQKLPTTVNKAIRRLKEQASRKAKGKKKADEDVPEVEDPESEDSSDEELEPIFRRTRSQSKSASAKGKDRAEESEKDSNTMQLVRKSVKSDIIEILPPQLIYIDLTGKVSFLFLIATAHTESGIRMRYTTAYQLSPPWK
jgi:hypothetical protein